MSEEDKDRASIDPKGRSKTAIPESDAVIKLRYLLDRTRVDSSGIEEGDKGENTDGTIRLYDSGSGTQPIGTFVVQVKKLRDEKTDPPRFQADLATFSPPTYLENPYLLIGVDTANEVAYWEHITLEKVKGLKKELHPDQKSKVVRFSTENRIDGEINSYLEKWEDILTERQGQNQYKQKYNDLKKRANPAIGKAQKEFYPIHVFLDEYNKIIDYQLRVIKGALFTNTWKIGYASVKFGDENVLYGLYPIQWEENLAQIMEIEADEFEDILTESRSQIARGYSGENPVKERPVDYAWEVAYNNLKKVLASRNLNNTYHQFLAREFVFAFLNDFHDIMGLEWQDSYAVADIRDGYQQYLQLWVEEAMKQYPEGQLGVLMRSGVNQTKGIDPSILKSRFSASVEKSVKEKVEKRIKAGDELEYRFIIGTRDFPAGLFDHFLHVLESGDEKKVERPYRDIRDNENGWDTEAATENFIHIHKHFPEVYRIFIQNNFPQLKEELSLYPDATRVVIAFSKNNEDLPWRYHIYLQDKEGSETKTSVDFVELDSEVWKQLEKTKVGDTVEYANCEYEMTKRVNSRESIITDKTPLLEKVYSTIKDRVDEYFDQKRKG